MIENDLVLHIEHSKVEIVTLFSSYLIHVVIGYVSFRGLELPEIALPC